MAFYMPWKVERVGSKVIRDVEHSLTRGMILPLTVRSLYGVLVVDIWKLYLEEVLYNII